MKHTSKRYSEAISELVDGGSTADEISAFSFGYEVALEDSNAAGMMEVLIELRDWYTNATGIPASKTDTAIRIINNAINKATL